MPGNVGVGFVLQPEDAYLELLGPVFGELADYFEIAPETTWWAAADGTLTSNAFAGRFAELVGEPPLHYLTRWRMQKAAALLRDGQATLADIADRVGYESEAAFSKAFKRWVGTAPGAYRRAAKNGAATSVAA